MSTSSVGPDTPVMTPPPGVASDFDSKPVALLCRTTFFLTIMLMVMTLRVWTTMKIAPKKLRSYDYAAIAATIGAISYVIIIYLSARSGIGKPSWDIRRVDMTGSVLQQLGAETIIYGPTIFAVKCSFLLFYMQFFWHYDQVEYFAYASMLLLGLYYTGTTAYLAVEVHAAVNCSGDPQEKKNCARPSLTVSLVSGIINVITDIYIVLFPVPMLRNSQFNGRLQKIKVFALFGTGAGLCIVSIARVIVIAKVFKDPDILLACAEAAQLDVVEINVAIIISCMPAASAFYQHYGCFEKIRRYLQKPYGPSSRPSAEQDIDIQ